MSNQPTVKVNAHDKEQIDVAVSGELECGDDGKTVSYELALVKKG